MKTAVKIYLFALLALVTVPAFGQDLTYVTYINNGEVVGETLPDSLMARLTPISIIDSKPTLYKKERVSAKADMGAVFYKVGGKVVEEPGFASMWFDDQLRVYAWRDFKTLVEVTDVFLDFKPIK